MRRITYSSTITAACIVAGLSGPTTQAQAGVMNMPSRETITGPSLVENIHYRYWHHHHYWRHHWRYGYWRPYWRHRHYRYVYYYPRYYGYYGFNPVGALAGAAVGLATAPLWALGGGGWGYPYYW